MGILNIEIGTWVISVEGRGTLTIRVETVGTSVRVFTN